MGPTEKKITDMVEQAIKRDPQMLAAETGLIGGSTGVTQDDMNRIQWAAWRGVREAVIALAREIDELRDA
ncbi:MAG: hypothetical protein JO243_17025 [Solirubrobacterales bacterium]|nr:hypothetical protein [Solirubrobacterales bacterium]